MSRQLFIVAFFATLTWLFVSNNHVYAAAYTSTQNGNWNAAATWGGAGVPVAGDTVTIANGDVVTVTANAAATSITIPGGNQDSYITINNGISLTVSGAITLTSNSDNDWKEIRVGSGSLSAGSITLNSNGAARVAQITLSTGTVTVSGDISFTGSTSSAQRLVYTGTGTINLAGDLGSGGTLTTVTGSIFNFNGTAAQIAAGYSTYNILNMNNAAGLTITGDSTAVTLNLTSGRITTGTNTLEASANCTTGISGGSSSYVVGNLRLHYPTNNPGTTTCTFPIGDASTYTPVTNAMVNVSSSLASSTVTARTDTPDHSGLGTSNIDGSKSVNRTWTLTPGGLLTFGSYNATFNFVTGDIDSGATTANFIIGLNSSGVWSYPTVSAANATSTAASGMTTFGGIAIGEIAPPGITGKVFEDINYGGGAGRDLATSGGTAIPNARVELFDNAGNFVAFTTTNASGNYSFSGLVNGTYTVRVVNSSVASTRGCAAGTCLPVQTYRTNAGSGTANPVTNYVGGQNPTIADAGNSTTTLPATAQTITTVTKGVSTVTGVDFGFNFDTIVNTNNTGQGSLRQFIINANALTGSDTSIFMIPNGLANPGQNTGYANQLATSGANIGAAVITLGSALPTITDANTILDGTTQTTNVGNTNSGTVGTGGTVGTMAQTLPRFERPEVVISAAATQLTASGASVTIRGLAIANGGISVSGSNSQVVDCLCGMNADGTVSTVYSGAYAITIGAGTGILIRHNYTKVNNSSIRGDSPGANATIEYNEVDSPNGTPGGGHTNTFDGILIVGTAANTTIQYNLCKNQRGGGLEFGFAPPGTVISGTAQGNTITANGYTSTGTPSAEPIAIVAYALNGATALIIKQNVITGNAGPGIAVVSAIGVKISENSIYANGTLSTHIAIDLNTTSGDPNTYTAQGITLNDSGDVDTGPNNLLNFPVLESATIAGSNLILKGWARPGSAIEFFIADPHSTSFGSGRTYLTTLTEGSGADTDATSSTYGPGLINGLAQGTDTTNRFSFTIAVPSGVANGTVLTTTATLAGNTSEFSGNVTVLGLPVLSVIKYANGSVTPGAVKPGQTVSYTVTVTNSGSGTATTVLVTDQLSPYVAWGVNTFGAGIPFQFVDGAIPSGMTLGTPEFSDNYGSSWTYLPVSGGGSAPANYDGNVTNWRIPMASGPMNGSGASFSLNYRVMVK